MAKVSGSTRTTISVPADLKRRMDKLKEPVNWSALACAAFEQKLAEVASRKEKKDMDDVIQRFRGSKKQSEGEAYQAGYEAGEQWAKDFGEVPEMKRLDRLHSERTRDPSYDWHAFFSNYGSSAYSTAEHLYFAMFPEHDGDRDESLAFWNGIIDASNAVIDNACDDSWLRGFAEGALEVWWEVERHL